MMKQDSLSVFPLLTKFVVVMLIVLGVVLTFVIHQNVKLDLQNTLNILENEGSRLIYQIKSYSETSVCLEKDDGNTKNILRKKLQKLLSKERHILYIHVLDRNGAEAIHAGDIIQKPEQHNDPVLFSLINNQKVTHTYENYETGHFVFEVIEPIISLKEHIKGETLGVLRLGLLLDDIRSGIDNTRKEHIYTMTACTITTIITGMIACYFLIASHTYRVTSKALKVAEEENRIIMIKMKQSERLSALGEFSAGIAHEIRNPLASIKNFTQLLPTEYEDHRFRKEFVEIVISEVNRIDKIVTDLLNYARPIKIKLIKTDITSLVDEILYSLSSTFERQCIDIRKIYNQPILIEIDSHQIRQVLLNVMLNAVEAMPEGGTIEIAISTNSNKELEIQISDTGDGIPEHTLPELFNPFFTTKESGTGLGLSIAQRIVNEHEGSIDAKNKKAGGALFSVLLPVARDENEKNIDC